MKKLCASLILLFIVSVASPEPDAQNRELQFLKLKSLGRYSEALQLLAEWSLASTDVSVLEINLLRVIECLQYPELYDRGLDVLRGLENNQTIQGTPVLRERFARIFAEVQLRKGNIAAAQRLIGPLEYLDMHVCGPFKNSSIQDFNQSPVSADEVDLNRLYQGKESSVSWFHAEPDRLGIISLHDLLSDVKDSSFYFYREISVNEKGVYSLILGKCGFTDLFIDGYKIFSNGLQHGFCNDQYAVPVLLEKGNHRILVKSGEARGKLSLSLRVAGPLADNNTEKDRLIPESYNLESRILYSASVISLGHRNDYSLFRLGYYLYMVGVSSDEEREAFYYLNEIPKKSPYYSWAQFYMGKAENQDYQKERYYATACQTNPENIEAMFELAQNKIDRSLLYDTDQLLANIKKVTGVSPLYLMIKTEHAIKHAWWIEAKHLIKQIRSLAYPSLAESLDFIINRRQKSYDEAMKNCEYLQNGDRYEKEYSEMLIKYSRLSGRYDRAFQAMDEAISMHPNCISFKLGYADLLHDTGKINESLPYLAAAQERSPYNKRVLFSLARAYRALNNTRAADYYMKRLREIDPDNESVKRYLNFKQDSDNEVYRHVYNGEVEELLEMGRPYKEEPALVLLDEESVSINSHGSHSIHKRKVVAIQEKSAVDHFKEQYIVFSPETEHIEKVTCTVLNNGIKSEVTERYLQSLSDPESRLYYDVKVLIIPVNSLRKGSILDISYTINSRSGKEMRGYYGYHSVMGNSFRTILYKRILSHPRGRTMFNYLKGIEKRKVSVSRDKNRITYHVKQKNLPPHKHEVAMPDESNILPQLCFTTMGSWDEVYRWYKALLSDRIVLTEEMKSRVHELIAGAANNLEKVRRIYNHVSAEIRYVGFELGLGGLQPRRADLVYDSKMGDCKDMSVVLTAMLKEAGIKACVALVRTRERGEFERDVPYPGFFNHAVCYVNLGKGIFLDATAKNSGFLELPGSDRDVHALIIGDKSYSFINTSDSMYEKNRVEVTNTIDLSSGGQAVILRNLKKQGETAPPMRAGFKNTEKKYSSLMTYWNNKFTGARVSDLKVLSGDIDQPVEYSYRVEIPGFSQISGEDLIFRGFLVTSDLYQAHAITKKRTFPLLTNSMGTTVLTMKFHYPDDYRLFYLPRNESFDRGGFTVTFIYKVIDGGVMVTSVRTISHSMVSPDNYATYREFARFINRKEHEKIVLTKKK